MAHLLTEREASRFLGLSVRTLQKWRLRGNGPPFVKLGSAVRYEPQRLQEYLDQMRRRSTSEGAICRPTRGSHL